MPFHAVITSPLGPILLAADDAGLQGLYFTDQRDLPQVPGAESHGATVSDPTAGMLGGRAIRTLRALRGVPPGPNGELFGRDAGTGTPGQPHLNGPACRAAGPTPLRLLQPHTPAGPLALLEQTRTELDAYWRGERQVFDMPLDPQGTAFQKRVWQALLDVPCGHTLSYGELAERAGLSAGHGRAVGTAVGSNPISIIIPCHRILARNGTLNGYGGGLERKIRLLEIEGFTIR